MLNGYDNPDPTPNPPLTGLDFNHRFPKGPMATVAPFSERVQSSILKDEERDRKPKFESSIVIPEAGLWRKIGNRTFYRLYGLDYVHHSPKKNGIQCAIDKAESRVFIKDGTYGITANEVLKANFHLEGETSTLTKLQATANNLKLLTVNAGPLANTRVLHMGFDANSKTGITGCDFNQTNQEGNPTTQNNFLHDFYFYNNTFSTLVDLTGCEASILDLMWADNSTNTTGEVYLKTFNGDITGSRLIWPQPGGTSQAVHVLGQQVKLYNSVPNQIMLENQVSNSITYTTTGNLTLRDIFLANAQPASVPRITNNGNQTNVILSLNLDGVYMGLNNSGAVFAVTGTGNLAARFTRFNNCTFLVNDATACKWVSSPGGSVFVLNRLDSYINSYISAGTGSLGTGDLMTGAFGQFLFVPPPAGWHWTSGGGWGTGANTPALPAGTGSGNAIQNRSFRPIRIYQTGMSGTHIIDSGPFGDTANATDLAVGIDPPSIDLDYGAKIYYATTIPASWKWYGL